MKRLRIFFAIFLLILALPFWRFIDVILILSPFKWPFTLALVSWSLVFVALPLKLIRPGLHPLILVGIIGLSGALAHYSSPLSSQGTLEPSAGHCGQLSYTGTFYPLKDYLSEAHRDDLEARNQMCWIRKLIGRVPPRFDSVLDLENYARITREKLLRPEIKYRASLPLIGVLYFTINTSVADLVRVKEIFDSFDFWEKHYTDEISQREYSLWNWPHSHYIKFEYGLIERNWQELIASIIIEEN